MAALTLHRSDWPANSGSGIAPLSQMDVRNLHNRIGLGVIRSASRSDTRRRWMIAAVNFSPPAKSATDIAPLANAVTYAPGDYFSRWGERSLSVLWGEL